MILIEKEDVVRLDLDRYPFHHRWGEVGSQEAYEHRNDPDVLADGPFLLLVNNEEAWAGQSAGQLMRVAVRRADEVGLRRWQGLADLYLADTSLSRRSLCQRIRSVERKVRTLEGAWAPWDSLYTWDDASDRVWSGLHLHQVIETRDGETREARLRL